jgi:hypothetical protein
MKHWLVLFLLLAAVAIVGFAGIGLMERLRPKSHEVRFQNVHVDDLLDGGTERLAKLEEFQLLGRRDRNAPRKFGAKDTQLGQEELHPLEVLAVGGEQQMESANQVRHGESRPWSEFRKCLADQGRSRFLHCAVKGQTVIDPQRPARPRPII